MVSTRIVIGIGAFIIFLSLGEGWITFSQTLGGYNPYSIGTEIGSFYGPCHCPTDNSSAEGEFWLLFVPLAASPGPLSASLLLFPISIAVAVVSFFRWKIMAVAGGLALLSGVLWLVGVSLVHGSVEQGLANWAGHGATSAEFGVWALMGPYQAVVGGAILLLGYLLSRMDKLDWPVD